MAYGPSSPSSPTSPSSLLPALLLSPPNPKMVTAFFGAHDYSRIKKIQARWKNRFAKKEDVEVKKLKKTSSFRDLPSLAVSLDPDPESFKKSLVVSDTGENSEKHKDTHNNGVITSITVVGSHPEKDVTYTENGVSQVGRVAGWAVTFQRLLMDKAGIATFTVFLKKEFSEENIEFWSKCEQYKKVTSETHRKSLADEIFKQHMSNNASDPVNVDSHAKTVTQERLKEAPLELFATAQKQIFQLMKTDSYSRFIKSELYKKCVIAELEGNPLPYTGDEEGDVDRGLPKTTPKLDRRKDEKKSMKKSQSTVSTGEQGEKRRRSLLPWNRKKDDKKTSKSSLDDGKSTSQKEDQFNNNNISTGRPSLDLAFFNALKKDKSQPKDSTEDKSKSESLVKENSKFCRVMLPDGSTTVIYAKMGQDLHSTLYKLCERRHLNMALVEVYAVGSDKPLDLTCDVTTMDIQEIKLELRVIYRLDLPNKKPVAVKCRPQQTVGESLKPVCIKFGVELESLVLCMYGSNKTVDLASQVTSIQGQRVALLSQEDFAAEKTDGPKKKKEWSALRRQNSKPPIPRATKSDSAKGSMSEDAINAAFKDLFDGNKDFNSQFDEFGVWDPENRHSEPEPEVTNNHRGIMGRRNSVGNKEGARLAEKRAALLRNASESALVMRGPPPPYTKRRSKIDPEGT